ncbi:hypothetical protein ACODUM_03300 [Stenotrophomonas maltophilia]
MFDPLITHHIEPLSFFLLNLMLHASLPVKTNASRDAGNAVNVGTSSDCPNRKLQAIQLYKLLLNHFSAPRPGFQLCRLQIPPYTKGEIKIAFGRMRSQGWIEMRVSLDASGRRYKGYLIALSKLGEVMRQLLCGGDLQTGQGTGVN